jgi:hypothetical protein
VLTVSVRDDPDPILGTIHRVTYDLAPNGYMCGSIDGVHTTVIRDEGHLWAWTDSGRTWVEFHKEIEYGNPNTTQLAAVATAHASLADELGAIVCCLK